MSSKILLIILALVLLPTGWIFFTLQGSPIAPAPYSPPKAPALEGPTAPNRDLARLERIGAGRVHGPEDVAVDEDGRIYTGTADGRIVRVSIDESGEERVETFARTGGRPLGLHFDGDGNLIVADGAKGLLSVDPRGEIDVLATEAEGTPLRLADDLDIAGDGVIYFSEASSVYSLGDFNLDLLEARPHGMLLSYDPGNRKTTVLLRDLYFANGVAVSRDGDFVLVNETGRYRTTRYWLKGPKAGTSDVFIDNLPGFPDGIASDRKGMFWLALYTVRNDALDRVHPYPWIKSIMPVLPPALQPKPQPYGLVIAVDEQGRITRSLHDPAGEAISGVSSAQPHGDFLYLGTLVGDFIGRYRL